ncbi:MAG: hypothetical protein M3Q71_16325, partial [Chloroflexota bacterium]|nr:hypothetical protein [Chloroflexota bacterium]
MSVRDLVGRGNLQWLLGRGLVLREAIARAPRVQRPPGSAVWTPHPFVPEVSHVRLPAPREDVVVPASVARSGGPNPALPRRFRRALLAGTGVLLAAVLAACGQASSASDPGEPTGPLRIGAIP